MNAIDIAVLAVLGLSGLIGLWRGLVHEVMTIVSWVVAAVGTFIIAPAISPMVDDLIGLSWLAGIPAWIITFITLMIVLSIISGLIADMVEAADLGLLNRSLGLVFGLARGTLFVSVLWIAAMWALGAVTSITAGEDEESTRPDIVETAAMTPFLDAASGWIVAQMPDGGTVARAADDAEETRESLGDTVRRLTGQDDGGGDAAESENSESGSEEANPGYSAPQRQGLDRLFESTDPADQQ